MISVCIATFNGEKYIQQQMASILSQIGEGDEVIVSDDGSTDKTLDILQAFEDKRIRVLQGPGRQSPIWNFEYALKHAAGEFIFLADQDDVWQEGKVERMMKALQEHACVVSDNLTTDSQLRPVAPSFYTINKTRTGKWYNLLVVNGYLGCCMAFRREVLEMAIPFPADTPMHDIWIGNVAAFFYDVHFIPDKLILFRRHENTASPTARKSRFPFWQRISFRLAVIKNLLRLLHSNKRNQ